MIRKKKINLISDSAGWALDEEKRNLITIFKKFGYECNSTRYGLNKNIYYLDRYKYLKDRFNRLRILNNLIAVDYFHGSYDNNDFKSLLDKFIAISNKSLIRVSNTKMYNHFKDYKLPNIIKIPIGLSDKFHNLSVHMNKESLRKKFGLPLNSFVVGSFQKDDSGWNNKGEPKFIKGPDIFINILKKLKNYIPNIHVLLTGPNRNFIKKNLSENSIKFTHIFFENYLHLKEIYKTIDVYLVTSRDEGGPKSILESMSCEIPIVSSNVGQATDLIKNNINGYLFELNQIEEAIEAIKLISKKNNYQVLKEGLITARANTVSSQESLWKNFLNFFK